jgi:hypothetical protein
MARWPLEKKEFVVGLIKAAAVPLAVGAVLVLLLLFEIKPRAVMAVLESIRRAIDYRL